MKEIADHLKEKYGPWGWMGQRAHDAAGINHILPLDLIISCSYGAEVPCYFREDDVFSVEKHMYLRRDWSNEDLKASLKGIFGGRVYARLKSYKKPVNLLCYRSVQTLENVSKNRVPKRPRIYAVPEDLKRRFDNKILLQRALQGLSLPKLPGKIAVLGRTTFSGLSREVALPFVVQLPYGSSGQFTFIVKEEKEHKRIKKRFPGRNVVIRKYIDGFSLNGNAVIVSGKRGAKVMCAAPSVQITGAPECSNFPAAFCGNDYAAARHVDEEVAGQVRDQMRAIGEWMAASGFRGAFGMDFVVDGRKVYPIEINPRFQNSTSLYTAFQSRQKRRDNILFLLHIAEFLQGEDRRMRKYVEDFPEHRLAEKVKASQVILHNGMKRNIVTKALRPGIYHMKRQGLVFKRPSASLRDCRSGEDILITSGIPRQYTVVEPNAPICKVQMLANAVGVSDKRRLTSRTRRIIKDVYEKLGLRDVEGKNIEHGKVPVLGTGPGHESRPAACDIRPANHDKTRP